MIDPWFREKLPHFTGGLVRIYIRLGVTPNSLTLSSLLLSTSSAYATYQNQFVWACVLWWAGRMLDGTDGILARATQQTSHFGAFLDIVCDMASYSVMILGFYLTFPGFSDYWIVILFLYVLCITTALAFGDLERSQGIVVKDDRGLRLGAGLAEGGETGLAYTVFLLMPNLLTYTLPIWIAVLLITIFARMAWAARRLGK